MLLESASALTLIGVQTNGHTALISADTTSPSLYSYIYYSLLNRLGRRSLSHSSVMVTVLPIL